MITNVQDRCRAVATFRSVSVTLMETIARWTPTIPEMEVKVMLGRHIWDFAQHADALGKRTFELRQPEHFTLRPSDDYGKLLDEVAATEGTAARLAALYDGVLPGLMTRYEEYVNDTDPILDQPSIIIIERILRDLQRQREEATALQAELRLSSNASAFASRDRAISTIFAERT